MEEEKEINKREFLGVWIQREIYLAEDLSWSEKILLVEITSLDTDKKGCFASNKYFAEFLKIKNEISISRMISKLKKMELIWEEKFDGRHRILHSNVKADLTKKLRQTKQKSKGRLNKNVKAEISENLDSSSETTQKTPPNNIVNNKDNNTISKSEDLPSKDNSFSKGDDASTSPKSPPSPNLTEFSGQDINELIALFEPINPSYKSLFKNKTQRKALEEIVKEKGLEPTRKLLEVLPRIVIQKYAPVISTPCQLRDKMGDLMIFLQRSKKKIGYVDLANPDTYENYKNI